MQRDRLPNALAKMNRQVLASAVADDADPAVVPVPVRMRLPFERISRWVVLDVRKLPARRPAAP